MHVDRRSFVRHAIAAVPALGLALACETRVRPGPDPCPGSTPPHSDLVRRHSPALGLPGRHRRCAGQSTGPRARYCRHACPALRP